MTCPGCFLGEVNMKTQQKKQKANADLGLRFDDKPVVPFEADILVAEDFIRIYRSRPISHEHELMVAVLEEALNDYQRCFSARDKKGRQHFADAETWIVDTDSEWIFSFVNCCEVLGIEPGYLRQRLLRRKRAKLRRIEVASVARGQKPPKRLLRAAA
jgi:hypothetical protein